MHRFLKSLPDYRGPGKIRTRRVEFTGGRNVAGRIPRNVAWFASRIWGCFPATILRRLLYLCLCVPRSLSPCFSHRWCCRYSHLDSATNAVLWFVGLSYSLFERFARTKLFPCAQNKRTLCSFCFCFFFLCFFFFLAELLGRFAWPVWGCFPATFRPRYISPPGT